MPLPTHLIIVCCHAIYLGPDSSDESNWLIEPFQKGETDTYIGHIEAGVRELSKDENALLVFSGGATKQDRTDKSEGEGYLNVAIERNLFGLETSPPSLHQRMFVDRFATDSYQNVLCSLVQFPLYVAEYRRRKLQTEDDADPVTAAKAGGGIDVVFPSKLTIVSHEFKRSRFLDLHLPAMRWGGEMHYIGSNPPFDAVKMAEIEIGDRLRGYGAWEKDLYGVGEVLSRKRKVRGWDGEVFRREVLMQLPGDVRTEVEGVVFYQGGQDLTALYDGRVPWG
ncbi:hypothetical protein LTR10_014484 [Elasticomyces elasticus]|uniref:DUF218 domain-containing protein n=1 Tax=Exophiala sideris TaxID=1016849 RepID=A0ABR0J039_9EURO|nr:hypothetical protein LTR10_014484 [Elasticomyces elasticus]KAK5023602.1 hypothetical protein LTS07_009110 [Exophiala sideris]KAK5029602.1 hypothetical protein LTR13_008522 [Exophiala sideris]KAK5053391.1 hypothetical protein LTR69_009349 [Exophiala sideris]KAK5179149.1 hypothetical protein LTR44_008303 [Eurotiomycetes sp. CCFEE 6388]